MKWVKIYQIWYIWGDFWGVQAIICSDLYICYGVDGCAELLIHGFATGVVGGKQPKTMQKAQI